MTQKILVAEDDPISQKVIQQQLTLLGHTVDVAADGAEAFLAWQSGEYKLLITDLHMPEMDGYALTRAIRDAENCGSRLPILALTANAILGEAEKAMAHGMNAYLTKPVELTTLRDTLDQWLLEKD